MADAPDPITSAPNQPGQPYDATSDGPLGPWVKVKSGPADMQGNVSGDWPDTGPWKQT